MMVDVHPEEKQIRQKKCPVDPVNQGSVGRVDWSPLTKLTNFRPYVSKYGLPRYSTFEWSMANDELNAAVPSADKLEQEAKNLIETIATVCDNTQSENTLRLKQRAVDIWAKHYIVIQYCKELKEEVEQMAQYKQRLRRALEYLGVVEGINQECREIRKNRLTEDLVRDEVEEELFQEKGLCQEIRQLYEVTLQEFENQYRTIKGCYEQVHTLWSDQKETLDYETECIALKNSSNDISFHHGNARFDKEMSSLEIWEEYMNETLANIKATIESSRALRRKIQNPILSESAKDLKMQEQKVVKAFWKRIDEVDCARKVMEKTLDQVLKEIAHAESLFEALERLGRQLDFSLKVVQTRLEKRSHRPGGEKCRDIAQKGLIKEVKVISERVTALEAEIAKIEETLKQLYETRKKLERQIHVKRHSLSLDQQRCMGFRDKYPNSTYLMGL